MLSPSVILARELVRIESVTPNDNGCQRILKNRLEDLGFVCEQINYENVSNLWARFGNHSPLLVFAGHTDVVPTGPVQQWEHPPFAGVIEEGMLHGRGAADMKSSIACFIIACTRFIENHPNHRGSIAFLITSDEEGNARWGTQEVLVELLRRKINIDMCIVGEPTSISQCGDMIKIGRRGSLNGTLTIRGLQGHIAYPHLARNPIHTSLPALADLVNSEWDKGNENFPPTSFQISNIHSGTGSNNIIPGQVEIKFNFRYSPETSDQKIKQTVAEILDRHNIDYDIKWKEPGYPYYTKTCKFIDIVKSAIREITGMETAATTTGGTSDGRFIAASCAQIVELGPLNSTIHQINERVGIQDIDSLTDIYEEILIRTLL